MVVFKKSALGIAIRGVAVAGVTSLSLMLPMAASATTVSILQDGGFEDPSLILPSALRLSWTSAVYGKWAVGDPMAAVGAVNGITPLAGTAMMLFSATSGSSSDVYQIVDVSAYAAQIDAGLVTVTATASYNSSSANSVGLSIERYASAPTSFAGYSALAGGVNLFSVDGDKSTWQQFSLSNIVVTAGTRYLEFGMDSPTSVPQSYADEASLVLTINDGNSVPEPATLAVLMAGCIGLLRARRK